MALALGSRQQRFKCLIGRPTHCLSEGWVLFTRYRVNLTLRPSMAGAPSQSLVLDDLISAHMSIATMAVVHTKVLSNVNPDAPLASLEVT